MGEQDYVGSISICHYFGCPDAVVICLQRGGQSVLGSTCCGCETMLVAVVLGRGVKFGLQKTVQFNCCNVRIERR